MQQGGIEQTTRRVLGVAAQAGKDAREDARRYMSSFSGAPLVSEVVQLDRMAHLGGAKFGGPASCPEYREHYKATMQLLAEQAVVRAVLMREPVMYGEPRPDERKRAACLAAQ